MENKIALGSLAASLSHTTGKSKKLCEDFLREFFKLASETLETGEPLRIKGFGTFKVTEVESRESVNVNTGERQEIASHKKVVFTPAKELATAINAPFRDFESVEIDDEMPDDYLMEEWPQEESETEIEIQEESPEDYEINYEAYTLNEENQTTDEESEENVQKEKYVVEEEPDETENGDENLVETGIIEAGSTEEAEDDEVTYEAYKLMEEEENLPDIPGETENTPTETFVATEAPEEIMSPTDMAAEGKEDKEVYENIEEEEQPKEREDFESPQPQKSRFGIGFLTGALTTLVVCLAVFIIGCFFDWWPENLNTVKNVLSKEETEQTVVPESVETEQEPEVPAPVYDTVSTTRYLTTIAREHYGDFNFWPYIYLANDSILGHPDRITPGTRIVVPPLSKYGVEVSNPQDVEDAKKLGAEIYSRYK